MDARSGMVGFSKCLSAQLLILALAVQAAILIARHNEKKISKLDPKTDGSTDNLVVDNLIVEKDHIDIYLEQRQAFLKYRKIVYSMTDGERAWHQHDRARLPNPSTPPTGTSAHGWRLPAMASPAPAGSSPGLRQY